MSEDTVREIKERANIVEFVGRAVPLKRTGKNWSGLCPFHSEKDGSFYVREDWGTFRCFGCGAHGDIISFYEKYYHLTFYEALERLAKECGIDYQPGRFQAADKSKDALYEVNRLARNLYIQAIREEGNPGLGYLLERGIDHATISRFKIGYADNSGRMVSKRVEDDEPMRKAAEEVGLIKSYNGRLKDMFEGRVVFPIMTVNGKVIGFGGRDIGGKSPAKYINSDGSRIFSKGSNLYGLNITNSAIYEKGYAILVEGYMDLVSLYKHGVENVCAQCGTAFTKEQAKLLKRYKEVLLALDTDEAGQKAAEAAGDILAAEGVKTKVIAFEGANDPDHFIRDFGREEWEKAVEAAVPIYDFKLGRLKKNFDTGVPDGLSGYLKAAARMIESFDPIDRAVYYTNLAKDTGVPEDAIKDYARTNSKGSTPAPAAKAKNETSGQAAGAAGDLSRTIIGLALYSEYAFKKAAECRHLLERAGYGSIIDAMLEFRAVAGAAPTVEELYEVLGEAGKIELDMVVKVIQKRPRGSLEAQADEYITRLEIHTLKSEAAGLEELLDINDENALMEMNRLQSRINELNEGIRKGKRGEEFGN